MKPLCFATNNEHKLEEIRALLGPFFQLKSLEDIGCVEELTETQNTIEGNSIQKAKYVFDHYTISCFADDTGLEVEALNGAPGVYSARYAGEHKSSSDNIKLLLAKLHGIEDRSAQFRSVITLVELGSVHTFEGIVRGNIIHEIRGEKGFGYDPIFQPLGYDRTFAEMTLEEKNLFSHRAIAAEKLINFLNEKYS
jgi:XTP/dITP diphosphohydrolase